MGRRMGGGSEGISWVGEDAERGCTMRAAPVRTEGGANFFSSCSFPKTYATQAPICVYSVQLRYSNDLHISMSVLVVLPFRFQRSY